MLKGIALIISACFIWGLIYVVPLFMTGFNPLEVAIGRYTCFGIVTLAYVLLLRRELLRRMNGKLWLQVLLLSGFANVGFYPAAVLCMQYANAAVAALILGMSPVTIALLGNLREKETSFRSLLLPCILMTAGLALVNLPALETPEGIYYMLGLGGGFLALIFWSFFAVINSRCLKRFPEVGPGDWCALLGIGTLLWTLVGSLIYFSFQSPDQLEKWLTLTPEIQSFIVGSLILGVLCSWIGFVLWNLGSTVLPVSLTGQLTIFETLFGLLFVYLLEQRLPLPIECLGMATMLGGIYLSIRLFTHPSPTPVIAESAALDAI